MKATVLTTGLAYNRSPRIDGTGGAEFVTLQCPEVGHPAIPPNRCVVLLAAGQIGVANNFSRIVDCICEPLVPQGAQVLTSVS